MPASSSSDENSNGSDIDELGVQDSSGVDLGGDQTFNDSGDGAIDISGIFDAVNDIIDFISDLGNAIVDTINDGINFLSELGIDIAEFNNDCLDYLNDCLVCLLGGILDIAGTAFADLTTVLGYVFDFAGDALNWLKDAQIGQALSDFGAAQDNIFIGAALQVAGGAIDNLGGFLNAFGQGLINDARSLQQWLDTNIDPHNYPPTWDNTDIFPPTDNGTSTDDTSNDDTEDDETPAMVNP